MKRLLQLTVLFFITGLLGAVDFEISTGIGYELYGVSAENNGFKADSYYHSAGLELGLNIIPFEFLETRLILFTGSPLGSDIYKNGLYYTSPDLTIYDGFKHHASLYGGVFYRQRISNGVVSAGPYGVLNNVVLTSKQMTSAYLYSYTLGAGMALRGEYTLGQFGLYGELKGHMNLYEYLVAHTDFTPSLSGGINLGIIWKI